MTPSPLHIVHFLPRIRLEEGGVVRSVLDLCAALAANGQQVTLLTHDATDAPKSWAGDAHISVVTIPTMSVASRRAPAAARSIIQNADVLHLHTPWEPGNAPLAREARRAGTPYIISAHGMLDDWSMAQRSAKKRLYLSAVGTRLLENAAFVHCTASAEEAQAKKWFPQGRSVVAPLVFELDEYAELPGPDAARRRWPQLANGRPTLLFLSRVHYKKGVDLLIESAAALRDRGLEFNLFIAGPGEEAYLRAMRALCDERGLLDRTAFVGLVSGEEKISLYEAADLFVLPTSQENFGFVFFEALAAGTPVVTTTGVDTWPELEESGGAVIVPREKDAIVGAVEALLRDEIRRASMGRRGRNWTLQRFGGGQVVQDYLTLYRRAMDEARSIERVTMDVLKQVGRKGGAASAADPFWVSKYLYRPVTIYFTWLCAQFRLSANGVTLLSALAIFAGAVCYGLPNKWAWLAGALLVQLYFILDHVDGEMARYERAVLRRRSGMAGVFYDTACHAGETAVLAAISLRLFADLGQPWWIMAALIVALFPGGIDPWQRYSETVLEHLARQRDEGDVALDVKFAKKSSIALSGAGQVSPLRRAVAMTSQTIGFPGYFVTLLVCTVLDLIPALQIVIFDQPVPYLAIWLMIRALHKAAAGVKSTLVYGRRLRGLG